MDRISRREFFRIARNAGAGLVAAMVVPGACSSKLSEEYAVSEPTTKPVLPRENEDKSMPYPQIQVNDDWCYVRQLEDPLKVQSEEHTLFRYPSAAENGVDWYTVGYETSEGRYFNWLMFDNPNSVDGVFSSEDTQGNTGIRNRFVGYLSFVTNGEMGMEAMFALHPEGRGRERINDNDGIWIAAADLFTYIVTICRDSGYSLMQTAADYLDSTGKIGNPIFLFFETDVSDGVQAAPLDLRQSLANAIQKRTETPLVVQNTEAA